jgi:hypothetical protein
MAQDGGEPGTLVSSIGRSTGTLRQPDRARHQARSIAMQHIPLNEEVWSHVLLVFGRRAEFLAQTDQNIDFVIADLGNQSQFLGCELRFLENSSILKLLQSRLYV